LLHRPQIQKQDLRDRVHRATAQRDRGTDYEMTAPGRIRVAFEFHVVLPGDLVTGYFAGTPAVYGSLPELGSFSEVVTLQRVSGNHFSATIAVELVGLTSALCARSALLCVCVCVCVSPRKLTKLGIRS
jgi:hypothetical protein